ncbi:MAG: hypothetical protein AAFN51_03600 [Pseudomonadota bacterium]
MSLAADFSRAVGGRIAHVTAHSNLHGIEQNGLRPAADLARQAGVAPDSIALRTARLRVGSAVLTHQRPIAQHLNAAGEMLEGHDAQSWAAQLDQRVFFWPQHRGPAFARSVKRDLPTTTIWLDAHSFAREFGDFIDLCAINSGNFSQGGARVPRGDWIYRPLSEGLDSFHNFRTSQGLMKSKDRVGEISLRCALPTASLKALRVPPSKP